MLSPHNAACRRDAAAKIQASQLNCKRLARDNMALSWPHAAPSYIEEWGGPDACAAVRENLDRCGGPCRIHS